MNPDQMLPEQIARMIEYVATSVKPLPNDLPGEIAREHGGIPLMGDIGGAWLLRPDGSFWEIAWDSPDPPKPLPEDRRIMAVAVGIERYPWLSALLPAVPPNARTCLACRGEGRLRTSAAPGSGVLCPECQALGWKAG